MSEEKKNRKLTAVAFCRISKSNPVAKHHLNLQERCIQYCSSEQSVSIQRTIKLQGAMMDTEELCNIAKDTDVLYIASPDRITRSSSKFMKFTNSLNAVGVEVRIANTSPDSLFDEMFRQMQNENYYMIRSEAQRRARKNRSYC